MLKHLLTTVLVGFSLASPRIAQATSPVRTIQSAQAQGHSGTLPTILVWDGSGTNLNFMPTGELIQRVWLDDPSRITLDFDTPLCQSRDSRSCGQSSASVIHLRRIKPLYWSGLPRTNSTLLTVITQGKTGRKLYQFRVAYGSGNPQYSTLEIRPDAIARTNAVDSRINLQQVERGLQVAIARGFVRSNARIVGRINRFLALSDNGADIPTAARQAGISLDLVNKLASLGTR